MFRASRTDLDLTRPRTIPEIFATAANVYLANVLLWLLLTALVVIPYQVVLALVAHSATLSKRHGISEATIVIFTAAEFLIVQPLVAALQVHAVAILGDGEIARMGEVFRRAAVVLANVIAAEIIAGLCIFVGFFLFLIPGIYLWLRLYVVAQAAAIEHLNWPTALRRGFDLSRGSVWRILGVAALTGLINLTVETIGGAIVGTGDGAAQIGVAMIVAVLVLSFTALLNGVLYFDLRAREPAQAT